jgi:5-methylcytosine-specific restriction endonuclease McrA
MSRVNEFSIVTQRLALARQRLRCASCGTHIVQLGLSGRGVHNFGEGAQAHHVRHVKAGGLATLENCVVICQSCHYVVHEGGNYRHGAVQGLPSDFPHYNG